MATSFVKMPSPRALYTFGKKVNERLYFEQVSLENLGHLEACKNRDPLDWKPRKTQYWTLAECI